MSKLTDTNQMLNQQAGESLRPRGRMPRLVWFYGLWICLAAVSALLGHSVLSISSALFLLGGIASTNFFFLSVAQGEKKTTDLAYLLATYQAIMGVAWTTAYYYFSSGAGDLVLGMYMTVLMFAVSHLDTVMLRRLSFGALCSYLLILGIKLLTMPALVTPLEDGLRFLVLLAITVWIYMFASRLRDVRQEMQDRNNELESTVRLVTRIAEEDDLTKSYNRRYIMDVLSRESSRANRSGTTFSILLLDLDRFKNINDAYGHVVGDHVLSEFARRIKNELRGMDSLNTTEFSRSFGRYGGEEFIAVLPGTTVTGAEQCGERLRQIIADRTFDDKYDVTVSIGVAEYLPGETVPQLLTRTDQALYRAKRDGRNRVRSSVQEVPDSSPTVPNLRVLK